jgi:raffinose/stachyose/melibiose transport system substrate-binding protein
MKYITKEDFEALLKQLREGGMENPVIINKEDWSIGSHFVQYFYGIQDGTIAGAEAFIEKVRAKEASFVTDPVFNACMDMFDLYMEYNINKQDPLSADYDVNASYLAEGEAAFWINGTWAWPNLEPFAVEGQEYSIMHMPVSAGAQGKLLAQATKFIVVDNTTATEEQQAAAKDFLYYLTMTDEGQKALVEDCGIVSAFTNNPYAPEDPVNSALATDYMSEGLTVNTVPFGAPSDFPTIITPYIQKLVTGLGTDRELADALNEYWTEHDPLGRE